MTETKVQIGDDVLLDIGTHSDWYISAVGYNGESVDVVLRRKADEECKWWLAGTPQMERSDMSEIDKIDKMIKMVDGILGDDDLCEGCEYVNEGLTCAECRRKYADEIIKILRNVKRKPQTERSE